MEIPKSIGNYEFKGHIGSGSFSQVYLAYDTETELYYACKVSSRLEIDNSMKKSRDFEDEIRVMQRLDHPNICKLHDIMKDDKFYYVFMEYCSNGELFDLILKSKKISEYDTKVIIKQIMMGVQYMHVHGVAHRDLKPENILFDCFGNVKIVDFGFSKIFPEKYLTSSLCGTLMYISPEILQKKPYDPFKSDVWSIGVIIFALLTGCSPWTATTENGMCLQIKDGAFQTPSFLSDQVRHLISRMMDINPRTRISLQEAINHPWLQEINLNYIGQYYVNHPVTTVSIEQVNRFFGTEDMFNNSFVFGEPKGNCKTSKSSVGNHMKLLLPQNEKLLNTAKSTRVIGMQTIGKQVVDIHRKKCVNQQSCIDPRRQYNLHLKTQKINPKFHHKYIGTQIRKGKIVCLNV